MIIWDALLLCVNVKANNCVLYCSRALVHIYMILCFLSFYVLENIQNENEIIENTNTVRRAFEMCIHTNFRIAGCNTKF